MRGGGGGLRGVAFCICLTSGEDASNGGGGGFCCRGDGVAGGGGLRGDAFGGGGGFFLGDAAGALITSGDAVTTRLISGDVTTGGGGGGFGDSETRLTSGDATGGAMTWDHGLRLWLKSAASGRLCRSCCFWWAKALGGETKISYRPFCPSSGGSLPQDQV